MSSSGWRVLTYLTAIPVFISSTLSALYLPESPRWLLSQGRTQDAEEVIAEVARVNDITLSPFRLKHVEHKERYLKFDDFFSPQHVKLTIPLWIVWFCFGFSYYGVILFVNVVFEKHNDADDGMVCDFDYAPIFYSACSELIGLYLITLLIDDKGRVFTQTGSFVCAAIFVALMGIHMAYAPLLIMSLLARASVIAAVATIWLAVPEYYPTEIRTSGHAAASLVARFGAMISPYCTESSHLSLFGIGLIIAMLNLIGAGATTFLPETKGMFLLGVGMGVWVD